MRKSARIESAAIQAVARHFSATVQQGSGPGQAYLTLAGKRIAIFATAIESRARRATVAKLRLRFDRVALGLVDRLQAALYASVPDGTTVVATITAPIKLPSRTAAALEERIRSLVAARAAPARRTYTIHGNEIQVHLLKGGTRRTARLVGFVHNRDSDPTILIGAARSLLARLGAGERAASRRWLVVASQGGAVPAETCRRVWSQLGVGKLFDRTLVVVAGGRIATLST